MIGVCRPELSSELGAYTTADAWMYFLRDGKAYHRNNPSVFGSYANPGGAGDRIGVMINEGSPGTISFYKNGERLGQAFTSVSAVELRPCVDMYGGSSQRPLSRPASQLACLPAVYACKRVFAYQFSSLPPYLPNNTLTMPAAATLALADHGDSVRMIGAATPPV